MAEDLSFDELIRRVRVGDQQAATELVRRYEPAIRRSIRFRLANARLGRILDSMDICQSVMASFFTRAAEGQYNLEQPEQLLKLLVAIARSKLAYQARTQRAQRRDHRRVTDVGGDDAQFIADDPNPSRQVAARDLLEAVRGRLSPDERQLADWRQDGREWSDIAAQLGSTPEALRKKLARAIERVRGELHLDESML